MHTLTSLEINMVTGGTNQAVQNMDDGSNPEDLGNFMKRDALYGSVGMSLLFSPAGWTITCLGLATGLALGLGVGYLQWMVYS